MNEARPYASLSSGLLARKGAAKPAMRPQGYTGFEDLGWNDMGYSPELEPVELPEHVPSSIAALTPLPKNEEHTVAAQQRAIAETFDEEEEALEALAEPEAEAEAAPVPEAPRAKAEIVALPKREPRKSAATDGRKTAFTLRLDTDRHLRLRLACAVTGRSAQQIVSNALDALLETIPEIEALAERVPASKRR